MMETLRCVDWMACLFGLIACGGPEPTDKPPSALDQGDTDGALPEPGSDTGSDTGKTDAGDDSDSQPDVEVHESTTVVPYDGGVSARWSYETAYHNVGKGEWYAGDTNEEAGLAWGESYVMMSLNAMFRATRSPAYLDRLAWHADQVLAQRDDVRGVEDYRGVSGACWRNLHYQPGAEPYCYVVHSGMIAYPMVEFARLVDDSGLGHELAYDGVSFADKADAYVAAAEQTVAYHDDQWRSDGSYVFRTDASFLSAGNTLPLNQANAFARLLLALHDTTHNAVYLDKATAMAERLSDQLSKDADGAYVWNYSGGAYASPGEDISHAAINVDFAVMCAERGVVFGDADLDAFAATFVNNVYLDEGTISDFVGGGSTNGAGYRPQVARWLRLAAHRTTVYTAIRDLYETEYPPESIGSGSHLAGWGYLAEHEPVHCGHFFYSIEWSEPDPTTGWRAATSDNPNVLTSPPDLSQPCMVPVRATPAGPIEVEQWDGESYHTVARWTDSGERLRRIPFEPAWGSIYWKDGVLFQFREATGLVLEAESSGEPPSIVSTPAGTGTSGDAFVYTPASSGAEPYWWSLTRFPSGARIDAESGSLQWTPTNAGLYSFTLRLQNDRGWDEQSFTVRIE